MFLKIEPESLRFSVAQGVERVTLRNTSDENVVYKVKTTAPDVYCVRPNVHTLKRGQELELEFIFLGRSDSNNSSSNNCNRNGYAEVTKPGDKFLIISVPVGDQYFEKDRLETEWETVVEKYKSRAVSKKIPVIGHAKTYVPTRKYVMMVVLLGVIIAYIIRRYM